MMRGHVVRFDQVKGYGFVHPTAGGEDVFLHVNDLLDPKYLIRPGVQVDYEVERGDRGLKASSVRVATESARSGHVSDLADGTDDRGSAHPGRSSAPADDDDYVDVVSEENFIQEVTEILLAVDPELRSNQIKAIRVAFSKVGKKYGWLVSSDGK